MDSNGNNVWQERINRHAPLGGAVVGLLIVASSMAFLNSIVLWYITILVGLIVIVAGFLYAARPILTNQRRYFALRAEVDRFLDMVRHMNRLAVSGEDPAEFEKIKSRMIRSIERMERFAGVEGPAPESPEPEEEPERSARIPAGTRDAG